MIFFLLTCDTLSIFREIINGPYQDIFIVKNKRTLWNKLRSL